MEKCQTLKAAAEVSSAASVEVPQMVSAETIGVKPKRRPTRQTAETTAETKAETTAATETVETAAATTAAAAPIAAGESDGPSPYWTDSDPHSDTWGEWSGLQKSAANTHRDEWQDCGTVWPAAAAGPVAETAPTQVVEIPKVSISKCGPNFREKVFLKNRAGDAASATGRGRPAKKQKVIHKGEDLRKNKMSFIIFRVL